MSDSEIAAKASKRSMNGESAAGKKRRRTEPTSDGSDMDLDDSADEQEAAEVTPEPTKAKVKRAAPRAKTGKGSKKVLSKETVSDSEEEGPAEPEQDDADEDLESEDEVEAALYPLEGKYKDAADRAYLMTLTQIQREEILAEREEEKQEQIDAREIRALAQNAGKTNRAPARASTRKQTVAPSKTDKAIDALKKSRTDRIEKKTTRSSAAPKRDRKPANEESDEEVAQAAQESEGSEEETYSRRRGRVKVDKPTRAQEQEATHAEINSILVTRDQLTRYWPCPWFAEWAKDAYVRVLVGVDDTKQNVYRLSRILSVEEAPTLYRLEDNCKTDKALKLAHGSAERIFEISKVSNSPAADSEVRRLKSVLLSEKRKPITARQVEQKLPILQRYAQHAPTEADITTRINVNKLDDAEYERPRRKARLLEERAAAEAKKDTIALAKINVELTKLEPPLPIAREPSANTSESAARIAAKLQAAAQTQPKQSQAPGRTDPARRTADSLNGGGSGSSTPTRLKAVKRMEGAITPSSLSIDLTAASETSQSGHKPARIELDLGDF
ncbi:hypothetical protein E5Q_05122 [Mixia osmundae IAM 14324]|uniref:Plus3 domain-containing protein n=2 Tax=Mixia osmundae (strain CBS 9802 / IAM 14324 / JCM 22182 / KY 12970) TaxID=764103 RepID=G7E6H6_MIXOS|nr:hypothetical protein E5Q_05122 [Mixia osmundae IAM 14324]